MDALKPLVFDIAVVENEGRPYFKLVGSLLNAQHSQQLRDAIEKQQNSPVAPGRDIVLDLSDFRYMVSIGLGEMIHIFNKAKQGNGSVYLVGPTGAVQQLFAISKLQYVFKLVTSVQEAYTLMHAPEH